MQFWTIIAVFLLWLNEMYLWYYFLHIRSCFYSPIPKVWDDIYHFSFLTPTLRKCYNTAYAFLHPDISLCTLHRCSLLNNNTPGSFMFMFIKEMPTVRLTPAALACQGRACSGWNIPFAHFWREETGAPHYFILLYLIQISVSQPIHLVTFDSIMTLITEKKTIKTTRTMAMISTFLDRSQNRISKDKMKKCETIDRKKFKRDSLLNHTQPNVCRRCLCGALHHRKRGKLISLAAHFQYIFTASFCC